MRQPFDVLQDAVSAVRERLSALTGQSERTILLGTVLLASALSAATCFVLTQYFSIDGLSSLVFVPSDCYPDSATKVGRHCFGDYALPASTGLHANPWQPYEVHTRSGVRVEYNNYPAGAMLPPTTFGLLGKWLGAPQFGLFGYEMVSIIAVLSPALWAARGTHSLERVVVFVACGAAAIPAWMVIDRGNSVGFVVPIALVFFLALRRRRWGLVAIMVVLAALIRPQFAVLAVALFAARQWRFGGATVAGIAISNVAAYVLWPRDFPRTIAQSVRNTLGYANGPFQVFVTNSNMSFGKGVLTVPDAIKAKETGGKIPDGFLAGPRTLIGYAVLFLVVIAVLALGRRIPAVMVGILLLATGCLFPPLSNPYYLVFVLPIAAILARDPEGPPGTGIFDQPATVGGRRRAVGICVSLAAAICIAPIALPSPPVERQDIGGTGGYTWELVVTTMLLAPILWLVACAVIIVSYARRPVIAARDDQPAGEVAPDTRVGSLGPTELITEFSPQRGA